MSIYSSIDAQSLFLTQKLLEGRSSPLVSALPQQSQSRYAIGEVTIEIEIPTINKVIEELTIIGNEWLKKPENECYNERKQIMSYILKQWIRIGEETNLLHASKNHDFKNRQ